MQIILFSIQLRIKLHEFLKLLKFQNDEMNDDNYEILQYQNIKLDTFVLYFRS